jgi:sterol desaturase/sphingolipid hydroxylase (fatty acid hydroxylase superfamily)
MNTLRVAVRYGYLPVMLIGVNAAGIGVAEADAAKVWLVALLGGAIGLSFAAERILPYDKSWNADRGDTGRDIAHALVNETLILSSVAALPAVAAVAPEAAEVWPGHWPFPAQVMLAILAADAGITLMHFASHKIGLLWRFHAVHHSVERFYGFNGLMKHPLHQAAETIAGLAPLLLAGMPEGVASALAAAVAVQLLLQHSNADYWAGPLTHLLALNQGHRFHHVKWPGIGDVNFGLFTLVWDYLLGTHSYVANRRFTSADLGMAARPHYPGRYLAQLGEPFRRRGRCTPTRPTAPSPQATTRHTAASADSTANGR